MQAGKHDECPPWPAVTLPVQPLCLCNQRRCCVLHTTPTHLNRRLACRRDRVVLRHAAACGLASVDVAQQFPVSTQEAVIGKLPAIGIDLTEALQDSCDSGNKQRCSVPTPGQLMSCHAAECGSASQHGAAHMCSAAEQSWRNCCA
jgi:hypothetical protein